jgi:hypothetical protein
MPLIRNNQVVYVKGALVNISTEEILLLTVVTVRTRFYGTYSGSPSRVKWNLAEHTNTYRKAYRQTDRHITIDMF